MSAGKLKHKCTHEKKMKKDRRGKTLFIRYEGSVYAVQGGSNF